MSPATHAYLLKLVQARIDTLLLEIETLQLRGGWRTRAWKDLRIAEKQRELGLLWPAKLELDR